MDRHLSEDADKLRRNLNHPEAILWEDMEHREDPLYFQTNYVLMIFDLEKFVPRSFQHQERRYTECLALHRGGLLNSTTTINDLKLHITNTLYKLYNVYMPMSNFRLIAKPNRPRPGSSLAPYTQQWHYHELLSEVIAEYFTVHQPSTTWSWINAIRWSQWETNTPPDPPNFLSMVLPDGVPIIFVHIELCGWIRF